jgi:hypothetical protein
MSMTEPQWDGLVVGAHLATMDGAAGYGEAMAASPMSAAEPTCPRRRNGWRAR